MRVRVKRIRGDHIINCRIDVRRTSERDRIKNSDMHEREITLHSLYLLLQHAS
jgi:hypothetical protein